MARFVAWVIGLLVISVLAYLVNVYAGIPPRNFLVTLLLCGIIFSVGMWIRPVVNHIVEPSDGDSRNIFIILITSAFIVMTFVFIFAASRDWDTEKLGTYGDFIGGTLNPILTFLTFVGLLFTIVIQQREVHDAKKAALELQKERTEERDWVVLQQFENTFFQMLNYHNSIVNSIDVHRGAPKGTLTGRESFKFFFDNMQHAFNSNTSPEPIDRALNSYRAVWGIFQKDLAHYYRFLYNLVRFVNQSKFPKTKYIRIMRAQLSDYEMSLIFYNGLTKGGSRFKEYIEYFTLFDNLPDNVLLEASHRNFYHPSAFDETAPKQPLSFVDVEKEII